MRRASGDGKTRAVEEGAIGDESAGGQCRYASGDYKPKGVKVKKLERKMRDPEKGREEVVIRH